MVNTDNIHSSGVSKVTGMVHVLEKAILDRQYLQGTLMPSQNELCRLYGVSARQRALSPSARVEDLM